MKDLKEALFLLISAAILLLFVLLVADKKALIERWNEKEAAIYPNTPEWTQLINEYVTTVKEARTAYEAETLTPEMAAKLQAKIVVIENSLMGSGFCGQKRIDIVSWAGEVFAKKAIAEIKDPQQRQARELLLRQNPDQWRQYAHNFNERFLPTRDGAVNDLYGRKHITDANMLRGLLWLIKWYYLLTIPGILILLLGKSFSGESAKTMLLSGYREILFACLGGPFGLMAISDTLNQAYLYRREERRFWKERSDLDIRKFDHETVEQIIWTRVTMPEKTLEDILSMIKSGQVVHRPAMAVMVVWLMGVFANPLGKLAEKSQHQIVVFMKTAETEFSNDDGGDSHDRVKALAILPEEAELPTIVVEEKAEGTTRPAPGTVFWEHVLARGPPAGLAKGATVSETNMTLGLERERVVS